MHRQLVAETTLHGLRPLSLGTQRIQQCWSQIDSYLRSALGEHHANLFAEPIEGQLGRFAWFAAQEGAVTAYADLPDGRQRDCLAAMQSLVLDIENHIEQLQNSGRESDRRLAETLMRALSVPLQAGGYLYEVAGKPVLVNWGTRDDSGDAERSPLRYFIRQEEGRLYRPEPPVAPVAPVVAPAPAVVVVEEREFPWWWLLWLLFLVLLGALFYRLILSCALTGLGLNYCPAPSEFAQAQEAGDQLAQEVRALEAQLDNLAPCAGDPPLQPRVEPPAPPPPASENAEFDERLREAGGQQGDLTITLIWEHEADLDLVVECPGGLVSFKQREACGGILDIDANVDDADIKARPVENITWVGDRIPPGEYRVHVINNKGRSAGTRPVPFELRVKRGDDAQHHRGEAAYASTNNKAVRVTAFKIE